MKIKKCALLNLLVLLILAILLIVAIQTNPPITKLKKDKNPSKNKKQIMLITWNIQIFGHKKFSNNKIMTFDEAMKIERYKVSKVWFLS